MSPPTTSSSSSKNSKKKGSSNLQPSSRKLKAKTELDVDQLLQQFDEEGGFDIIEEDPDIVTEDDSSSSDSETTERPAGGDGEDSSVEQDLILPPQQQKTGTFKSKHGRLTKQESLGPNGGLKDGGVRMRERVKRIEARPISLREYLDVLDWDMLRLFVKVMLGYFFAGLTLAGILLVLVYFLSEDTWYEYFPAPEGLFTTVDFDEEEDNLRVEL